MKPAPINALRDGASVQGAVVRDMKALGLLLPGTPEHQAFWSEFDAREEREANELRARDAAAEADGWRVDYIMPKMQWALRQPCGTHVLLTSNEVEALSHARCRRTWRISVTFVRTLVQARHP